MNCLRAAYSPDLKSYPLLAPPKVGHERKLTGCVQHKEPKPKKPCGANPGSPNNGKQSLGTALPGKPQQRGKEQPAKKVRSASQADVEFLYQEPKNFIQWMSSGSATHVTLWAFDFIGQTKYPKWHMV